MMPSDMVKREIEHLNDELERVIQNHQFMLNRETQRIYERIEELQSECKHIYDENGTCKYCGYVAPDAEPEEVEETTEDTSEEEGAQESEE